MKEKHEIETGPWWKVEVIAVGKHPGARGWEIVCETRNEAGARKVFADIEAECASNRRGHTEIKLWRGGELRLHIYWNRDVPNKADGTRDWTNRKLG